MSVQASVQFANVDLLIGGRFDRAPVLRALGDGVTALHEDALVEGKKCLLLEVTDPGLDLPQTLKRLVEWVERLPPKARRSWSRASVRQFDIGIESGMRPRETQWIIPARTVAALAKIGADVALTVYGAEQRERGPSSTPTSSHRGQRTRRRCR